MSKTYRGVGGITLPNDEFPAKITKGFYRVLEDNTDTAAELGAYRLLANAIKTCDDNPGSCVVADAGVCIYQQGEEENTPSQPEEPKEPSGQDEPEQPIDHEKQDGTGDGGTTGEDVSQEQPGSDTSDEPGDDGSDPAGDNTPEETDSDTTEVVGYAKLKTLMNVRTGPSPDADLVRTYKEDTIVAVTQFCDNGWLRILCEESKNAYLSNENGKYATVGKSLYTVKKDDNLWKIAEEQLGDGSRYKEISDLNFLVSNRIKVGMSLILPEVIPTAEET